jgi:hypothetical protein
MGIPTKVFISIAIIGGIAIGTGMLVFGVLMTLDYRDDHAGVIGAGASLLAGSVSALVAHLAGGFRDLDDREP